MSASLANKISEPELETMKVLGQAGDALPVNVSRKSYARVLAAVLAVLLLAGCGVIAGPTVENAGPTDQPTDVQTVIPTDSPVSPQAAVEPGETAEPAVPLDPAIVPVVEALKQESVENMTLTIYYLPWYIFLRAPLTVDMLINDDSAEIVVLGKDELAETVRVLKEELPFVNMEPASEPTGRQFARLYYILEANGEKVFDLSLYDVNGNMFFHGTEIEFEELFYRIVEPYIPDYKYNPNEDEARTKDETSREETSGTLVVNGKTIVCDYLTIHENNAELPLTQVLTGLGADVVWLDNENAEVYFDGTKYSISLAEKSFMKSDSNMNYLDPPPGNDSYICIIANREIILDSNTLHGSLYLAGLKTKIEVDYQNQKVEVISVGST